MFTVKTRDRLLSVEPGKVIVAKKENLRFYPQLNGLRFIFIFMVLLHHWGPQNLFEQYRIGWTGVDLFFVLSGFLIGEILLIEKERSISPFRSIARFMVRRALRIFPLYYITVLLYAALFTTGGLLVWNLTYTNNIFQAIHVERVPEEFWHIWSLCVEEQFYFFFPFLLFFVNKKHLKNILLICILLSVAGRFATVSFLKKGDSHILMPFCLDSLFLGVLLAYLKIYNRQWLTALFSKKLLVCSVIIFSIAGLLTVCYINSTILVFTFLRMFGSVAGFFLIGYSVIIGYKGMLRVVLENRVIAFLGKISYGIYLLHPFIEKIYYTHAANNGLRNFFISLHRPVISNRYIIDFIFLFSITIAISYLSFQLLEKRFLKLKQLFS